MAARFELDETSENEKGDKILRAGLVDEYNLLIAPIIAGGGNPYFPAKVRVKLELLGERKFGNGLVYVWYRAKN